MRTTNHSSRFIEMFSSKQLPLKHLPDISENLDKKRVPITSGDRKSGKYPYYGASGIVDYVDDYIFDETLLLISEDGANLKDRVTPIAFQASGQFWVNNHAHVLRFDSSATMLYVEYLINGMDIEKYLTGMAQPKLNQKELNAIPIPFPSESDLHRFQDLIIQADKSKFGDFKSRFIEMFGGDNWVQKSLGEVGSFTRGGGFQKSDFVENGIPCIHYGQIHTRFGPFITSHITELSSDLESKTKFASKGDLIIAITSEDAEGSCKSTAWLGDYPVAVGSHAAIYKHSMNPLYMSFFFKSTLFNHAKMEFIHGTKVIEMRPDDMAKIMVPCPPLSLQEQFSAIAEQADKSKYLN